MPKANRSSKTKDTVGPVDFLDTGSTLLNLAASQKAVDGGWARGRINNIVGDGSTGKTLLALEACANAFYFIKDKESHNFPKVENASIVYNNVEGVMDFPISDMYGEKFNKGVEWIRTGVIQDFGKDFLKRVNSIKDGDFLLYVVDSWDALDSEDEYEAFLKSIEKDSPQEGSFDLGKQRYGSKRFFKTLCSQIEGKNGQVKKDCTLMIVSQVRKKIGVTFGKKTYRAGGDALNFYTHQVCWLADKGRVDRQKLGTRVVDGINVLARFERNKTSKPFREAEFQIIFDYGIDDMMSMIQYLYGPKDKAIKGLFGENFKEYKTAWLYADKHNLRSELVKLTEEKWRKVEQPDMERKRRFPE